MCYTNHIAQILADKTRKSIVISSAVFSYILNLLADISFKRAVNEYLMLERTANFMCQLIKKLLGHGCKRRGLFQPLWLAGCNKKDDNFKLGD